MDRISLLFTLDDGYTPQLRTLLTSAWISNPGERFSIFLLQSSIPEKEIRAFQAWCGERDWTLCSIPVDDSLFSSAPSTKQYPKEMYYRLLSPHMLPTDITRILYLDPDMLIINPLRPLWEMDIGNSLMAAASHTGITEIIGGVNRLRLGVPNDYYNSGVLLIDTEKGRKEIVPGAVFHYAEEHAKELLLPDQDILNALYGERIYPLDDAIWNYDARNYSSYLLRSSGEMNEAWVMQHTAILHFCGKAKPWKKAYIYRFGLLYRHYMAIAAREWEAFLHE